MIPGINPREMQKAMKRLGIKQVEIDANEVIIRSSDKEIIIRNPQVSKVDMMGHQFSTNWQGRLNILDADKSMIANKIDIAVKGEYAIKAR